MFVYRKLRIKRQKEREEAELKGKRRKHRKGEREEMKGHKSILVGCWCSMRGHNPPFYWTGTLGRMESAKITYLYRWLDSKKCGIIDKTLFIYVHFLLFLECVGIELTSLHNK